MKSFIAVLLAAVAAAQPDSGSPRAIKFAAAQAKMDVDNGSLTIIEGAFSTPESVFYDKAQDISFISNIVQPHYKKAGNGFISTLDANNKLTLKWATEKLNAPKGLYVAGDTLWVTDIDEVKSFNAKTGKWLTTTPVTGAEFLNDITVNEAGDVFVTDSGLNTEGKSSGGGKDAIYKISKGVVSTLVKKSQLAIPNGIYQDGANFVVTSFADKGVYRVSADGKISDDTSVAGQIDGIEKVKDEYLVSSWVPKRGETKEKVSFTTVTSGTIMRGKVGGTWRVEVDGIHAPADIGYNSKKNELLIPMFMTNEVRIYSLNDWASKRRGCSRACKKAADVAFAKAKKDDMVAWSKCNKGCVAKHTGASILALGAATFLTVAAALF